MSQAPMSASASDLLVRSEGGVVRLTLNRPDRRNALSRALVSRLREALDDVAADRTARVVVLAAEGPVFCAGHDLGEMVGCAEAEHRELVTRGVRRRAPGEGRAGAGGFDRSPRIAGRDRGDGGVRRAAAGDGENCEGGSVQDGSRVERGRSHTLIPREAATDPGVIAGGRRRGARTVRTARRDRRRVRRRAPADTSRWGGRSAPPSRRGSA